MPTLKSLNLYDLIDQSRAEENMFDVEFIVLNPDWRAQGSMKGRVFKWKFSLSLFFADDFCMNQNPVFLNPEMFLKSD
jgi:hypothetical protein